MKNRCANLCQMMALALVASFCMSVVATAADKDTMPANPRYTVIPAKPGLPGQRLPAGTLQEWNGSFTYNNNNYNYVMVGQNPDTNEGTIVTTWIVPTKLVLSDGSVWDPLQGGPFSPVARTVLSPIFDETTTYTQGGVDVGTSQYNDAVQRANFWSVVSNNTNYHVRLGGPSARVTILPEVTFNVPSQYGSQGVEFGVHVALVDINWYDEQISNYMTQSQVINPTGFPIFENANTYLTEGGCCIGGYHSANGAQTYANFEYISTSGVFGQDVSALSHEVGEWIDDPLYPNENNTPCGILEVGDPLEGDQGVCGPYGVACVTLNNFTYHLQDLVFLRYFGGPADGSVNDWWTFQNHPYTTICQQGS
jgi:hypothetical protein